jgi:hypothetical protein
VVERKRLRVANFQLPAEWHIPFDDQPAIVSLKAEILALGYQNPQDQTPAEHKLALREELARWLVHREDGMPSKTELDKAMGRIRPKQVEVINSSVDMLHSPHLRHATRSILQQPEVLRRYRFGLATEFLQQPAHSTLHGFVVWLAKEEARACDDTTAKHSLLDKLALDAKMLSDRSLMDDYIPFELPKGAVFVSRHDFAAVGQAGGETGLGVVSPSSIAGKR